MHRQVLLLSSVGVLCILIFYGTFKLFQNDKIYHHTIGAISQNYERTGGWDNYEIRKVSKPFLNIENENYLRWDASIYNCISTRMYSAEKRCYGKVRAAFFPLFPMLWRATQTTPIGISIMNSLMFILSISLLVAHLLPGNGFFKITVFACLVTLPTTIIYLIPYSESLFLMCTTIAVFGILKNKYALYFLGILFMSMVRPATLFVLLAIIATEAFLFIKYKRDYPVFRHLFSKLLPFLIGYILVLSIQYFSSGSWTAFIDAQKYWTGGIQGIESITDWSIEGFGMNAFALFFVGLPSVVFLLYLTLNFILKKHFAKGIDFKSNKNYLLLISCFYLSGIFLFTLLTSGGNFHSFFRFTMCSPFFYIAILILIPHISRHSSGLRNAFFGAALVILGLFLYFVEYGGDRLQFSFFGLFMLLSSFLYLLHKGSLPAKKDAILLVGIVLLNTAWNTYMLNIYFSNGWLFT